MPAPTVPYDHMSIRDYHISVALSSFDIPPDVDTCEIRIHFTRNGRQASKAIRLTMYDLLDMRDGHA